MHKPKLHKPKLISGLVGVGLFLGTIAGTGMATPTEPHSSAQGEFKRIEQPFAVKLGVAAGGLSLIGLELWWFLWSKPKAK